MEDIHSATAVKHEKILSFTRGDLDSILSDPNHTPKDLLSLFEADFKDEYAADVGVFEGYSLSEHTQMVLGQFQRYFKDADIGDKGLFEVTLALHDIGKPKAVKDRNKDLQHENTKFFIEHLLGELGYSEEQITFAESLVDGDPIGKYLQRGNLDESVDKILGMSRKSGQSTEDFWKLLKIYYQVDAASYTEDAGGQRSLDHLFTFDHESGKMDFSPEITQRIQVLERALMEKAREEKAQTKSKGETNLNEQNDAGVKEKIENERFPEAVSAFINSEDFLGKLHEVKESERDEALGPVVEYFILHPDGKGIETFIDQLFQKGKRIDSFSKGKLLVDSVKEKFGIDKPTDDMNEDETKQVYEYIYDHALRDGYMFHGFNGAFESSIREHGLNPNEVPWDMEEIGEVAEISRYFSVPGVEFLGFISRKDLDGSVVTSSGKNYFDGISRNFYRYATGSPEWFNYMCSDGKGGNFLARRDYEGAKNVVEEHIKSLRGRSDKFADQGGRRFTLDDEIKIRNLFEKSWARFAGPNSGPKLALIRRSGIKTSGSVSEYDHNLELESYDYDHRMADMPGWSDEKPSNRISSLLHKTFESLGNRSSSFAFDASDISIIDLPSYGKVVGE